MPDQKLCQRYGSAVAGSDASIVLLQFRRCHDLRVAANRENHDNGAVELCL